MLVVAFDGMLFNSLEARATAVVGSLQLEGVQVSMQSASEMIVGRSLAESVRALALIAGHAANPALAALPDETALDVAALRAENTYAMAAARGFEIRVQTREFMHRAAAVTRVVVRADSRRRDVEALLQMAGLAELVSTVRCCDDPGNPARRNTTTFAECCETLERSYAHIAHRFAAHATMLGERTTIGVALEAGALARSIAERSGFTVAPDLVSVRFAGMQDG